MINVLSRQGPNVIPLVLLPKTHRDQVMNLPLCLAVLVVTVGVVHSAPEDLPPNISEDTLNRESAEAPQRPIQGETDQLFCSENINVLFIHFLWPDVSPSSFSSELSVSGEKLVGDEVRSALYGVKQMREVMWRNAQKHQHLMASLVHSGEKKKVRAASGEEDQWEDQQRDS